VFFHFFFLVVTQMRITIFYYRRGLFFRSFMDNNIDDAFLDIFMLKHITLKYFIRQKRCGLLRFLKIFLLLLDYFLLEK